jgi:chemosensory pili system protein ChpA (sensor histidine kinase/response regulator)
MLESAENCLGSLDQSGKVVTLRSRPAEAAPAAQPLPSVIESVREMAAASAPVRAPVPPPIGAVSGDSEFVHLFIEEARENVAQIGALFPQWEQNPLELEALRDVRRSFHTLKGSGRMVGALRLGEFAWSIENLLNRVLSQTLTRSPEIVAVMHDAVALLPVLVDELEYGSPPVAAADAICRPRGRDLGARSRPPARRDTAGPGIGVPDRGGRRGVGRDGNGTTGGDRSRPGASGHLPQGNRGSRRRGSRLHKWALA